MRQRLDARTLTQRDPAALGGRPVPASGPVCEDCRQIGVAEIGLVHIGGDDLARAHVATYAQDLIDAGWPGHIHLIALDDGRTEDRLAPQDCLYSLTISEPERIDDPAMITSIARVSTGWKAAVDAIASDETRMVTLTVGKDAYRGQHDQDWELEPEPESDDGAVPTVPEMIARGLGQRDRTLPPPVIAPLDDVFMNGETLRMLVMDAAGRIDAELEEWIEIEVEFPNSVVDRMATPATGETLNTIEERLGLSDAAALVTERHRSWVIESVEGLPPLADVGVELTRSIVPFERRRLWLLDGPRLALATAGAFLGLETIADVTADPGAMALATRISRSAAAVMLMAAGGEPDGGETGTTEARAESIMVRLSNPAVTRTCRDVCAEGSATIPMGILPVADGLLIAGLGASDHALVVAAWLALVAGMEIDGRVAGPIDDPLAGYMYAAMSAEGPEALVRDAFSEMVVPDLPGFADEVLTQLNRLIEFGTEAFMTHGQARDDEAEPSTI